MLYEKRVNIGYRFEEKEFDTNFEEQGAQWRLTAYGNGFIELKPRLQMLPRVSHPLLTPGGHFKNAPSLNSLFSCTLTIKNKPKMVIAH